MIDEYERLIRELSFDLTRYALVNARKWDYYDAEAAIKNIGLAVPQSMVNVDVVLGWPEIVVDALDERLDWLGWSSSTGDVSGLKKVFRDNRLGFEFDKAKIDALVTGVGFLEVTQGGDGEPDVIVNAVSSQDATYRWDGRANRVEAGLVRKFGANGEELQTLYLPDRTVTIVRDGSSVETSEVVHNRGVAGLVPVVNRSRASDLRGRSEITKAIRYYTDHGVRTLLGMEYNREIYTTPQRWYKNVYAEDFGFSEDDSAASIAARGVKIAMNRTLIMEPNINDDGTNGPEPATGQYQSAPPTPYIEQLKMLSQLCSAQSGVPSNYFGFHSDQPPSADAIRALESRLVKKAERRQSLFDEALLTVARISQHVLDGVAPSADFLAGLSTQWRDAATPTRAAATDAAVKLAQADVVAKDSTVLLEMVGFTPEQIERIQQENARDVSRQLLEEIRSKNTADTVVSDTEAVGAPGDDVGEEMSAVDLDKKFDALGKAIRAGVDPADAARRVGMAGIKFTGATPVSLRTPEMMNHDGN